MTIVTKQIQLRTKGELDIVDITALVDGEIGSTGLKNGIVVVFVPGSTGAVTTIEYEPGLLEDLPKALEEMAPRNRPYAHDRRWHDGNGHSHVRASILGPSLTIPFKDGHLILGTWQQIVFVELDIRSRSRRLILQVLGE